jgi:signal transduction histidine kinase
VRWLKEAGTRPWLVAVAAIGGLLIALTLVGLAGLALNQRVATVTEDALEHDIELEDEGDDLRAAVLEVRHQHRNLAFADRLYPELVSDFEDAYAQLVEEEIRELEEVGAYDPSYPQPDEIRAAAREYYGEFRPSVDLRDSDRATFDRASDRGLDRLDRLQDQASRIDELGEEQTGRSLTAVEQTTNASRLALIAILLGVVLIGCALAYAAVRMVGTLRRLYAEGQETSRKLAEANQAKADFLADASHELRTPLTVLRVNAEVGLGADEKTRREVLEEILHESDRMGRLVEDLLFLARSDSSSLPLAREPVAVEPFLAELAGRASILARERGAALEADLQSAGTARLDPSRVEQAVLILVDNAAKYGEPGGRVTLTSRVEGGSLCVGVEDRGPGISEEDLPRIFERFYRVDKARVRKQGGTGLGLPIARTIAEAHGGSVTARSTPDLGTTMTLCLPLVMADARDLHTGHLASERRN